ncbi:hypothetical protein [Luteibacter sp. 3190]|uniref:hypothetical protein n=1 Tax=Luteibacter sp. 3190 TaxID=2817736 RepID=UPI00285B2987|nr:hypothetical protein [Luteibacter sp. 3190]MDR6938325.1 hypothetical protein [Luteibacter sp. 3190]
MTRLIDGNEFAPEDRGRQPLVLSGEVALRTHVSRRGRAGPAKAAVLSVLWCAFALPASAMNVKVNITNNTAKPITNVSSTYGLPHVIDPWRTETVTLWMGSFSSSVSADFASGQVPGGCLFQAGHEVTSTGPVYAGNGAGYGQVLSPFCWVNVFHPWSPPYDYEVTFMISQ